MKIELEVGSRFKCNKGNVNIIIAIINDKILYKFFNGTKLIYKTEDKNVVEKLIDSHVYRWC